MPLFLYIDTVIYYIYTKNRDHFEQPKGNYSAIIAPVQSHNDNSVRWRANVICIWVGVGSTLTD